MANIKKPSIAVACIIIAATAATLAAPLLGKGAKVDVGPSAFGIKATDSIADYQRQPDWREVAPRLYAVAPPNPEADFGEYAVRSDPDTNRVCAVSAATESEPALARLKVRLTAAYGEPSATPANGWRWSKGTDYVEIENVDTLHYVIWDFTGSCLEKNRALSPDRVTDFPAQYEKTP